MSSSTFLVTDISLADTPTRSRRGVLIIDAQRSPPSWQVVVYDPRPESFSATAGLELPFSCRDAQGTLLTGWVSVGAGDAQLGVWCLRGRGRLRSHRLWHRAPRPRQIGPSLTLLGPQDGTATSDTTPPQSAYATPSLLHRLASRRSLLAAATLILCAWGVLSLVLDIGGGSELPVSETSMVRRAIRPAPVLSLRVAILEQLGFDHRWVELRDALALQILRTNGVAELHALLPGPGCVLATDRGGRCEVVLCDLMGERQRYRAVVRQVPVGSGGTYLIGLLVGIE